MTYVINEEGVVYEKDLGPDTVQIANRMTTYRPDSTWRPADRGAGTDPHSAAF